MTADLSPVRDARPVARIERVGKSWRMFVHDRPFLIRGGEVHNSSGSSRAHMAAIWPKLKQSNLNTVLVPVSWESFEPKEGQFDYNAIDWMIEDARANGLKVIVLWFASYKNGESHYAPLWVKRDRKRFPFGRGRTGTMEILSTFGTEARDADARAFAQLCARIAQKDTDGTIIGFQVQNEVGFYGDSRDRSEPAEAAFGGPVPKALMDYLVANETELHPEIGNKLALNGGLRAGTWTEVFGPGDRTDEIFMAWHNALYVSHIASAGKQHINLPMFVNAAEPEDLFFARPGQYVSGGPCAHLHDIWRAASDAFAMYAADLYMPEFTQHFADFNYEKNAAFMPEMKAELEGAANIVYAIGRGGLGGSPFGIESRTADFPDGPLSKAYKLIEDIEPLIVEHQSAGTIISATVNARTLKDKVFLGDYAFTVQLLQDRRTTTYRAERGYVMIMQEDEDQFLIAGYGVQIRINTREQSDEMVGLGGVQEGRYESGKWVPGRWLNGDELRLYRATDLPPVSGELRHGLRLLGGTSDIREGAPPVAVTTDIQRVTLYRFRR